MTQKFLNIEDVLTILAKGPPHIAALAAGLSADRLRATPPFGGWSANEVLAHLRACADVWGGAIEKMLAEDHPTIPAVNPRTWINQTDYLEREFHPSLQAFAKQRKDLLRVLESLAPKAWSRAATVTGAGKPLERTVLFYADWLARHERSHYKQLKEIANSLFNSA